MQFTLREILLVVTLLAIGLCGVTSGHPATWVASFVFVLILFAKAIDVIVAIGPRRNFAIGFTVASVCYLALLGILGESEFEVNGTAHLPTSIVAQLIVRPSFPTNEDPIILYERKLAGRNAMPLAHLFFAAGFGYLGGCYARWSSTQSQ